MLLAGAFAVGTDGFMIVGLLPAISSDLRISVSSAAQLITVFALTYALLAPAVSILAVRVDRAMLLCAALAGLSATNVLAALAPSFALLLAARVGAATCAAAYTPTAALVAADLAGPAWRGRALSLISGGLTLAIATGVPLGNLIGNAFGWRTTFLGVGILAAILAAVVRVALPVLGCSPLISLRERMKIVARPGVARALLITMLGILAGYLGYSYVAPITLAIAGSHTGAVSVMLVLYGLGAITGNLLCGHATDRLGAAPTLSLGVGTLVAALLLLALLCSVHFYGARVLAGGALFVLGVGCWTISPPQQHRLLALAPDAGAIAVSLNSSAIYVGLGLSGLIGGLVLDRFGAGAICLAGAAIAVVVLLILPTTPSQPSQQHPTPSQHAIQTMRS
ncbi:MAG: MFS transporter [Solirubrobacteraceae bacterium]